MCDNTSSEPSEPVRDRDGHDRADDSVASSGEVISVALIDDNRLVREGIATLNQVPLTIRSVASGLDVLPDLLAPSSPRSPVWPLPTAARMTPSGSS